MAVTESSDSERRPAERRVTLVGLDFGSTTSSALVATSRVERHGLSGCMEFADVQVVYRSEPAFTPFDHDRIDAAGVERYIEAWFAESQLDPDQVWAGGAIVTGLAAESTNAVDIAGLVRSRIGETLIALADDPCLESWLAFMGSSATLSRYHADRAFVNLDIGGGTTNPALGRGGQVLATGCYFVGARHFQVEPGTYKITDISKQGRGLAEQLELDVCVGRELTQAARDTIVDFYIAVLESLVKGAQKPPDSWGCEQVAFTRDHAVDPVGVTFSGGVGELVYRHVAGESWPSTTAFGDLGIDLAQRVVSSPVLARDLQTFVPENGGRATVHGLTLHNTEISGTTLFLSDAELLPICDLPVVATVPLTAAEDEINWAVELACRSRSGACLQVVSRCDFAQESGRIPPGGSDVKAFGERLARALDAQGNMADGVPLVLLIADDVGQTLGNYVTCWRQSRHHLIVIDEVPTRDAQFVNVGRPQGSVVPVSFYGLRADGISDGGCRGAEPLKTYDTAILPKRSRP